VLIEADRTPGQHQADLTWEPGGIVTGCTASNDSGVSWTGARRGDGTQAERTEDRAIDSDTNDRTIKYSIKCTGPGGDSDTSTVAVRYRRKFYPYIKTQNGDVSIMNE